MKGYNTEEGMKKGIPVRRGISKDPEVREQSKMRGPEVIWYSQRKMHVWKKREHKYHCVGGIACHAKELQLYSIDQGPTKFGLNVSNQYR